MDRQGEPGRHARQGDLEEKSPGRISAQDLDGCAQERVAHDVDQHQRAGKPSVPAQDDKQDVEQPFTRCLVDLGGGKRRGEGRARRE